MRALLLGLLVALGMQAQPTCSSPVVDDVGPTWARLRVSSSATINYTRVVYGGVTVGTESAATQVAGFVFGTLGGLTPGTPYTATLQASADGVAWCSGQSISFSTLPATSWLPAPPVAVSPDPRSTPPTTGTTRTAATCSDVQALLAASVPGDKLVIPAGLDCSQADWVGSLSLGVTDSQLNARGWYKLSAIDIATDTLTRAAHGLAHGDRLRIGWWNFYGRAPKGLDPAVDYYLVSVTTNTFKVSLTSGGPAVDIVDVPFGNPSEVLYSAGPLGSGEVLIVGSNDASLPPSGVTVRPDDRALMPTLRGTRADLTPLLDLSFAPSPLRVRGIRFLSDAPATSGQPDPPAFGRFVSTSSSVRRVTLERNIFEQSAMYPQRTKHAAVQLDGVNVAFIDNYASLQFWRPWNKSVNPTITGAGATLNVSAGVYYLGHKKCSTAAAAATITGGSAGGTARVWMQENCNTVFQLPNGYTGSCLNCTLTNAAVPAIPETNLSYTAWPLAQAGMSATFDWVLKYQHYEVAKAGAALGSTESGTVVNTSFGPGPTLVDNNEIVDSPGVTVFNDAVHWDNPLGIPCDGATNCGTISVGDWVVTRNRITYTDATRQPDDGSETLRQFSHRNAIEAKDCRRCLIEGNYVHGNYRSVNAGPTVVMTPLTVGATRTAPSRVTIRDTAVLNNYLHGASGIIFTGRSPTPQFVGVPSARNLIRGNVILADASLVAPHSVTNGIGAFYAGHGPQLTTIDRNTLAASGSPGLWSLHGCIPTTANYTRNVLLANNYPVYGGGALWSNCAASPGSAPLEASRTAGLLFSQGGSVGAFSSDNVLIAGRAAAGELSQSETSILSSAFSAAVWPAGGSLAARLSAAGLNPDWSHKAGSPSRRVGADLARQMAARGSIFGAHAVGATSSTLTIVVSAPSAWQCYARAGAGSWVRASGTTARQSITLTGLTAATVYDVSVACAAERRSFLARTL